MPEKQIILRILVVEDDIGMRKHYADTLRALLPKAVLVFVEVDRVRPAVEVFLRGRFDAVVADGSLENPKGRFDTLPFVKAVRSTHYHGPLIAASGFSEFNRRMIEAGCTAECDKVRVPEFLAAFFRKTTGGGVS